MAMEQKKRSRREFLRHGAAGLAGIGLAAASLGQTGCTDDTQRAAMEGENTGQETAGTGMEKTSITRTLGRTGLTLPVVSMGVMNADNPNLVRAALDRGIVHLDTAHIYQSGRNEEMLGKVLKNVPRERYVLATKVRGEPADRETNLFTRETKAGPFFEKFELSLRRLKLDHVDILYLHSIKNPGAAGFEPLLEALVRLKETGKTRFIGISTHRNEPDVIRAAIESKVYDVVLTAYNFRQDHREEIRTAMREAAEAGLGVVVMKTQAGVYWDEERRNPINMKAALKWSLQDEFVHTAIPGFNSFDQMETDLEVMADLALTDEEERDLREGENQTRAGLFCRQCGRCVAQCRDGLPLPELMRSYMYVYGYRNLAAASEVVERTAVPVEPCRNCTSCSVQCSMGFDIRRRVVDIARLRAVPADFLV